MQIKFSSQYFSVERNFLHGCRRKLDLSQVFLHRLEKDFFFGFCLFVIFFNFDLWDFELGGMLQVINGKCLSNDAIWIILLLVIIGF